MTAGITVYDAIQDEWQNGSNIHFNPARVRDVVGRVKMSASQNIYEADFEYGPQPLRWESLALGGGAIAAQPQLGGVRLSVDTANGSLAIRQSRPYMRYQPGKTMYMASAVQFGIAESNNVQRVGFFDDSNGVFFEQATPTAGNPAGIFAVIRSDSSGVVTDTRFDLANWTCTNKLTQIIDWTRIQMVWIEYAWYGAGCVRWGIVLDGEPHILHEYGHGNTPGAVRAWSRTGNLPVRYETRNVGAPAQANSMIHYGVSVMVEGRIDDQRGFTYSYGMSLATQRRSVPTASTRFPVLTIRNRTMGTQEYTQASSAITAGTTTSFTVTGTPWTVNQWQGRCVFFPTLGADGTVARILSNTTSTATIADNITGAPLASAPTAGLAYTIGLVNRGQILPRRLLVSANTLCIVELISSNSSTPVTLTGASFTALNTLGSNNSFAERDVSATALTGGEVVYAFTSPSGAGGDLQTLELNDLFPLYNTIRGNRPDWLTVAVTNVSGGSALVGAHIIGQESMS